MHMSEELEDLAKALDQLSVEADAVEQTIESVTINDDAMEHVTLDMLLSGYALLKGDAQARTLINSKAVPRNAEVVSAEHAARTREQARKRQMRKRAMEHRAKREDEMNARPVDPVRMSACLALLGNLMHVIADLTLARYNRFRRVLGDVMIEDIAQDAVLRIAEALAKANTDMVEIARAAIWLKSAPQPYVSADGPEGAGRLLGTIVTVISRTIVDTYRANTTATYVEGIDENGKTVWEKRDTTLKSFELLETIAANTRTDIDEMISHTKANRKPAHEASVPGMREKRLFARMVIDAAIDARGLNGLTNMLLDDERVRSDGSFKWTENADTIWAMLGLPAMNTDNARLKAHYAKRAVVLAFEFLPGVIQAAYQIVQDPTMMWYVDTNACDLVRKVASRQPGTMDGRYPVDGGKSLEFSVALMDQMIDNPARAARALAMINADDDADN